MPILGINHVTLAVRDLDRATHFYTVILGARLRARWARGAYVDAGGQWLCLELDARAQNGSPDDSHVAFSVAVDDFDALADAIRASGARIWKENESEGQSLYFEDPDRHKLEIHVGNLGTRLAACRARPYDGMTFDDS